jgi:2-polyprenyl-3-methyl-5-hydroxy-6-metoxy-1,4-benzoquinol methylase
MSTSVTGSMLAVRKLRRPYEGRNVGRAVRVTCPLCRSSVARELVDKEFPSRRRLSRCDGCGVVRMVAARRFEHDYWGDDSVGLHIYGHDAVRADMRRRYQRYLPLIARLSGGPGALLDVGCGIGNFLLAARDEGWRVAGVEASAKAATVARSRGFDVETTRLEESRPPAGVFDAVTLWDVLPHFEEPVEAMRMVQQRLRPGGVLFVETPDEGFWLRAAVRHAFVLSRGRIELLDYFYRPEHRFYFTATTLTRLLEKAGFRTVSLWWDVTSPAKEYRKIAARRFPLSGVLLPFLPLFLRCLRRLGRGNKLMLTATKA